MQPKSLLYEPDYVITITQRHVIKPGMETENETKSTFSVVVDIHHNIV